MIEKRLLRPERLRQTPASFSWVDHRLVRHHHIARCDSPALALYLVLVTVADAQGLSFYSAAALERYLGFDSAQLTRARATLVEADLIAYQKPLYQVLSLEDPQAQAPAPAAQRSGQVQSVAEILRRAMEGGAA